MKANFLVVSLSLVGQCIFAQSSAKTDVFTSPKPVFSQVVQNAYGWFEEKIRHFSDRAVQPVGISGAENLIVITTDGLRWQEVFKGFDPGLLNTKGKHIFPDQNDQELNRKALMPFFWSEIAPKSQVFGNQEYGNQVLVSNKMHISYPGYSEIFCGYSDDARIQLNEKKPNPNVNILEWINQQAGYQGRVAAVASWELFDYILNEKRSRIKVNAGFERHHSRYGFSINEAQSSQNLRLEAAPKPWKQHVRPDTLTWLFAQEYLSRLHPKVLYIGFGETDEYAHEGNYLGYLNAAHQFDSLLSVIWRTIQEDPFYAGKTALMITTDHGRGRKNWQSHHLFNPGSDEIWMAVYAPGLEPKGEIRTTGVVYQRQFAQTMAHLIGLDFKCAAHPVASMINLDFNQAPVSPQEIAKTNHPEEATVLETPHK
jgi:hypothetical protein